MTLFITLITDSKSIPRSASATSIAPLTKGHHLRTSQKIASPSALNTISTTTSTTMQQSSGTARRFLPELIYGTAWKKERTQQLVELAVKTGFRAIDTACQPKHYNEKGVGDALAKLYSEKIVTREEIFLQTKFTSINGQDPNNIPYDRNAPLIEQVKQSFAKSQENLQTTYIDSLVMHSPMSTVQDTLMVWKQFEEFYQNGLVRYLGISNCYQLTLLKQLYDNAIIKPTFLQNRFYHETHYDREIREFCQQHDIHYQSFWTLTANPHILKRLVHCVSLLSLSDILSLFLS